MRNDVLVMICVILFTLPMISVARGDVGMVRVTKQNAAEHARNVQVTVRPTERVAGQVIIKLAGATGASSKVSAKLVVEGKPPALEIPLQITTKRQASPQVPVATDEWHVEIVVTPAMATNCTVDVLIDSPSQNIGTVYRIVLGSFASAAD